MAAEIASLFHPQGRGTFFLDRANGRGGFGEEMDAEGLGRKWTRRVWGGNGRGGFGEETAADPPLVTPAEPLRSRPWLLCLHLTKGQPCKHLRALSMPALQRGAAWAESVGCPPAVCPPNWPCPFAHCRFLWAFAGFRARRAQKTPVMGGQILFNPPHP